MREPPWILRALLRLYPPDHRRTYGAEIWEAIRARHARAGSGVTRRWSVHAVLCADMLGSVAGVWLDRGKRAVAAMPRGLGLDARFVLRSMRRNPGYPLTTVVVLAVAVAADATVFSYVRGTLLTEPPYPEPERIVVAWGSNPASGQLRDVIAGSTFIDLAREATTVRPLAAFHYDDTYITVNGRPEAIEALEISADFLDVLGIEPFLGRDFDEPDRTSGAAATVLVSYGFWRDWLDGDPGVVGRALELEGEPKTILGVMPPDFEFVAPAAIYMPLRDEILAADSRTHIHYNVIGRLAPGASASDATRELSAIMAEVHRRERPSWADWTVLVEPLHRVSVSAVRPVIWTLTATVALVLLVALVNLATLFRTRTLARADELSIRVALGAGWGRVARVLFLETATLAATGAIVGLALAPFLLREVTALVPTWIAIPDSAVRVPALKAVLDPAVLAVSFVAALLGALALTAPGFVAAVRRQGVARGDRVHAGVRGIRLLVGVEVAVATLLCLGAGLTARSAARLLSTDVGLEDRGLLTLYFGDVWDRDSEGQVAYFRQVIEAVEAIPGVRSAATIDYVDFQAEDDYAGLYLLDRAQQPIEAIREEWRRVGPGLFETAGMRMRIGRSFEPADFDGAARSAIVNEAFAAKHYPGGSPLGRFVTIHNQRYRNLEIVGVVADVRSLGPAAPAPPMIYVPYQSSERGTQGLYVRVAGEPMAFAGAVRDAIWSVDSSQPVTGIQPMSELVDTWVAIPRVTRTLVSALAAVAVLLSAVGVFGVVAFAVGSRRSELGLRLALGATPGRLELDLLRLVLPIVVLGVATGIVAGIAAARGARAVLYGVSPLDPAAMAGALAAIGGAALLATYLPARRVRRIDPVEAIRVD